MFSQFSLMSEGCRGNQVTQNYGSYHIISYMWTPHHTIRHLLGHTTSHDHGSSQLGCRDGCWDTHNGALTDSRSLSMMASKCSKWFSLMSSFFTCITTSKVTSDLIFLSSTMARCWGRVEQHYRRCCVWTTECCNATCQLFKLNMCTIKYHTHTCIYILYFLMRSLSLQQMQSPHTIG